MKMVFRLIVLLFSLNAFSCELKEEIVSLSGPVTYTLEYLGLLSSDKVKAISVFHPIKVSAFKGKILGGGLFLSFKHMNTHFNGTKIYFDQSRELSRMLKRIEKSESIELQTSGLNPFEVFDKTIHTIKPSLRNCDEKISSLKIKVDSIKKKILTKKWDKPFFFYLGSFKKNGSIPKLMMVNDGPVRFLKDQKLIKTYPSELNYVTWSRKILNKFPNAIHIGLDAGEYDKLEVSELSATKKNLKYRAMLIPGLSQIFFLEEFIKLKIF